MILNEFYEKIVVPQDYRIIGTLNTKDKNYLHRLSDALNRRFETIEIAVPEFDKAEDEMEIVAKKVFNVPWERNSENNLVTSHGSAITEYKDLTEPRFRVLGNIWWLHMKFWHTLEDLTS